MESAMTPQKRHVVILFWSFLTLAVISASGIGMFIAEIRQWLYVNNEVASYDFAMVALFCAVLMISTAHVGAAFHEPSWMHQPVWMRPLAGFVAAQIAFFVLLNMVHNTKLAVIDEIEIAFGDEQVKLTSVQSALFRIEFFCIAEMALIGIAAVVSHWFRVLAHRSLRVYQTV
jgi:hypothetical protein